MQIDGNGVDLFGLIVLALLVNFTAAMWAAGVAMRLRTIQAGPAMQMPVFIILFLAPVYVPLEPVDGWVEAVANFNPFTALVEGGRDLISGQSFDALLVFGVALGLGARVHSPGPCAACGAPRPRANSVVGVFAPGGRQRVVTFGCGPAHRRVLIAASLPGG